jgi:hypothetical protein
MLAGWLASSRLGMQPPPTAIHDWPSVSRAGPFLRKKSHLPRAHSAHGAYTESTPGIVSRILALDRKHDQHGESRQTERDDNDRADPTAFVRLDVIELRKDASRFEIFPAQARWLAIVVHRNEFLVQRRVRYFDYPAQRLGTFHTIGQLTQPSIPGITGLKGFGFWWAIWLMLRAA